MVGRFVENQCIGAAEHELQQCQTGFFAPGQAAYLQEYVFTLEEESAQDGTHFRVSVQSVGFFHFFQHGVAVVQQELALVVVAESHIMARLQDTVARRCFAQQNPQQCGLPHTIRSHDTDFFASLDIEVYILEEVSSGIAVTEVLGQTFGLEHVVAGLEVLLEVNLHTAHFRFRAFQTFQRIQTFFTGCSTLGQFLCTAFFEPADHFFLTCDFPLLVGIGSQFSFSSDTFLLCELLVVAIITVQFMMLHFKNSIHNLIEEVTVMGYNQDSSLVAGQVLFQPLQCADVQMVGRFVQHEDVRLFQQQGCQCQSGPFSSGKGVNLLIIILRSEGHGVQNPSDLAAVAFSASCVVFVMDGGLTVNQHVTFFCLRTDGCRGQVCQPLCDFFHVLFHVQQVSENLSHFFDDGSVTVEVFSLLQVADSGILGHEKLSVVAGEFAGEHIHQGGLARPVLTDDTDTVPFIYMKADLFDNHIGPVNLT